MSAADTPVFTVIRGRPTTAELAAVMAGLLATRPARSPAAPPARAATSAWADRSYAHNVLPRTRSWRATALPR
jgi:hypothetical protein